jgi:hypothetical protein
MLTPVAITERERGIEARYADGHIARITFDGKQCSCGIRPWGVLCPHLAAALPAYIAWKWRMLDSSDNYHSPAFLQSVGVDPRIFNRPRLDWSQYPEEEVLWVQLRTGRLFLWRDGAQLAVIDEHPDGGTKCMACGTRTCRHWDQARAEGREVDMAPVGA